MIEDVYRRNHRGDWFKNGVWLRDYPPERVLKAAENAAMVCTVRDKRRPARPRRRPTFAVARATIFERLRDAGWQVDASRAWPRALYRAATGGGSAALYFKPQAIWGAATARGEPTRAAASSTLEDPRDLASMEGPAMVNYLATLCERWIDREHR